MIRPYWSVLIDSFRAAFASRVLWIALLTIYLFLAALAPIGQHEVFTTTFRWTDISNGTRLKAMLAQGIAEADPGQTPAGRIARHLPEELQRDLTKVAEGQEVRIRLDILAAGLNSLYHSDDWYDAEVWANSPRLRELRELEAVAEGQLGDELRQRRARLRIEAGLPGVMENRGARSLSFSYAGIDFPAPMQIEKSQFQLIMNHFVLRLIIEWILGFAMIFLGILVTAAIIPDMLQAGSLHLLLSKPLSRPWLFLTKFLGGCAFVLVCVSQLIIGLWLIAGWRLEMWNHRLLLCIPVCVFLFAVFYSVSAIAGLKWRSPILAIGVANLFGAFCLIVWTAGGLFDSLVMEPDKITGLTHSPQGLVAGTLGGELQRFDSTTAQWVNLFPDDNGRSDRVLPPVQLADRTVASGRVRGGRMNVFGSGATPLLLMEPLDRSALRPAETSPSPVTPMTPPSPMIPAASIELPAGTLGLVPLSDGSLLVHNSSDLMVATADAIAPTESGAADDATGDATGDAIGDAAVAAAGGASQWAGGGWLPKLRQMMGGPVDGFRSILPAGGSLSAPTALSLNDRGDGLYLFSGGTLSRLQRPAGQPGSGRATEPQWQVTARVEAMPPGPRAWVVTLGEAAVLLLQAERSPQLYNERLEPLTVSADGLEPLETVQVQAVVSCQGTDTAAILASNGTVWLVRFDGARSTFSLQRLPGPTAVEAMSWDAAAGRLWLAHDTDRVSSWQWGAAKDAEDDKKFRWTRHPQTIRPSLSGWRRLQQYVITPLRLLTPQTGELGDTIAGLVSGEDAVRLPAHGGVESTVARYRFWRPLLTCSGFLVLMLTLGSYYFSKTDF